MQGRREEARVTPPLTASRIRRSARFRRNAAPGIHRIQHAHVNCYLVEEAGQFTIVDAALPSTWPHVQQALTALGASTRDVHALVLTHAHPDHLGFAQMAASTWKIPIWAHADERPLARHPYRYKHERSRLIYPLAHPASIPVLATMIEAGALRAHAVEKLHSFSPGESLDLPGRPTVIHTPGHTDGHCSLYLPGRDAVLSGDALVTFDPHTGKEGPQIISGSASADTGRALLSLDALARTDVGIMLPGHGRAWRDGIGHAAGLARRAGGF
jgi:glyoxylase-like metal-dependent hydrolase (beta-lactamase superfamily II)